MKLTAFGGWMGQVGLMVAAGLALAAAPAIQGGGASFPAPLYKRWAQEFEAKAGTHIEYNSQGSGFGVKGITDKALDFAGSDAPMSKAERAAVGTDEVIHLPSVAGAVVMTYNLPGYSGELKLTGEVIADIYLGRITKWNDKRLAELNVGGPALPDVAITPIGRSDGSGTTYVFTSYLATQSQDFIKQSPPAKTINLKGGQAGKGSEGVSNQVAKIAGALGYVELTYAVNEKLAYASVKNKTGAFVKPTQSSVTAAGAGAEAKMKGTAVTASIWNAEGADAYPIASFTYLLVRKDLGYLQDKDKAKSTAAFLRYCLTDGQSLAEGLSYAPLPAGVRAKALDALNGLTFGGKPLAE